MRQQELQTYFERTFPGKQDARVSRPERISLGWETEIFSFDVGYSRAGETIHKGIIMRMYPGNDAYEKSAKEFVTMKHLHEVGYPVPQVHHLERENSPWGKPFVPHHLPLSDKKLNAELVGKLTFVSVPPDSVMGTLINDITAESQSFILVLDDYHLITTPAIHQAMAYLCEHNQPHMQLVIISRADRPISISRLLVRGQFGR